MYTYIYIYTYVCVVALIKTKQIDIEKIWPE